jgi:hypothetical protein
MNSTHLLTTTALLGAALVPCAEAQVTPGAGFTVAGSIDISPTCGTFPAIHVFEDGSMLLFDGSNTSHRSADGTVLRDYGTRPTSVFASFVRVDEANGLAYIGESSFGTISELDLDSGATRVLGALAFNYDLAFDVVPGLAYVTGSPAGFGANALYRLDLVTGDLSQVAQLDGYSGPVEVDAAGNVIVSVDLGQFPVPPDSVKLVRFDSVEVTSGVILTDEDDGEDLSVGYDGISSTDYDPDTDRLTVIEVNTGPGGTGSVAWTVDGSGQRLDQVATVPGFAGGAQLVRPGVGTVFAPYQPAYTSLRLSYSQCFGTGESDIFNITPVQAAAVFTGPGPGATGPAFIDVEGGIPDGYAALWVARSVAWEPVPLIESIGGLYPVALQASPAAFGRRFSPIQLNSSGAAGMLFTQSPAIEGAFLFQWLIYDTSLTLVSTSTAVVNL